MIQKAGKPIGRKPKRTRTEAEVTALAARLAADWHPDDAVATWLRRHARELSLIVRDDGWSWTDVARALTTAGIAYRTGRSWNAKILRNKISESSKVARRGMLLPEQAEAVASVMRGALSSLGNIQHVHVHMGGPSQTAAPVPAASPSIPGTVAPTAKTKSQAAASTSPDQPALIATVAHDPAVLRASETDEDDGPRFELVSFADGWVPPPPQPEPPSESKPPPQPKRRFDPDEVLRRLHGRSKPTSSEEKK